MNARVLKVPRIHISASGPEATVARTQKLKLYRPRRFDLGSFVKGSARDY